MIDQNITETASTTPRLLRLPEVQRITSLSRSTIYDLMQRGAFPKQRQIKHSRLVVWDAQAVRQWVDEVLVA